MSQMPEIREGHAQETLRDAKDSYRKIKAIYDKTGYVKRYELGGNWRWLTDLHAIIDSDATAAETISRIQNTWRYSINPGESIREKMVDWYLAYLRKSGHDLFSLDASIQESPVSANTVQKRDRILTPDFLRTVAFYFEINEHCQIPQSRFRVVELGGGAGHLARTLRLFQPNLQYVDIDLPESLYFSYIFLRMNFPSAKTCFVTDPTELKGRLDAFDFVFVPTMFAESILENEFDLFANTASLGEVTYPPASWGASLRLMRGSLKHGQL